MPKRWAVFLDRDGTILKLVPYLRDPRRARLHAGAARALARLRAAGALLIVVTNQAGLARGLMSRADVRRVNARLAQLLSRQGVRLDRIEVCGHHPDYSGACACRKPAPGMLLAAARRLGVDLPASWMIGDSGSDLEAGRAAGTRVALVLTGYGRRTAGTPAGRAADVSGARLESVVSRILARRVAEGAAASVRREPVRPTRRRGREVLSRPASPRKGPELSPEVPPRRGPARSTAGRARKRGRSRLGPR